MAEETKVEATPSPSGEASPAPPAVDQQGATGTPTTETPPEPPKKAEGVQERIDELTGNWRRAEREAAFWRERALKQEQPSAAPPAVPTAIPEPTPPPRPSRDDFEDYEDYEEARDKWAADVAVLRMEHKQSVEAAKRKEEEARRQSEAAAREHEEWKNKGASKYSDFEAVALRGPGEGGPVVTQPMADAIFASDRSHDIAYFLGKNPGEARRIASLRTAQQIMEIGKLEARLSAGPPKPKTSTEAPPPISPVPIGAATTPDPDKMTTDEWMKAREKGLIQ